MINNDDVHYLKLCYALTSFSKDLSTHNASIIVNHKDERIAVGVNNILTPVHITPNRQIAPDKYFYTEHAERKAIFNAFYSKHFHLERTLSGCTLYACWLACADCARAIIMSGISRVVGHSIPEHGEHSSWDDSVKAGITMLEEARIKVEFYNGKLNRKVLFKGKEIDV